MLTGVVADGWEDRWVKSEFKSSDEGKWETSAGKFYGDEKNKGQSLLLLVAARQSLREFSRSENHHRLPVV